MKSNTLKIVINRPVAEVFEFTTNPDNTDKWFVDAGKEWTNEWPRKLGTIYGNNHGYLTVTEFELDKLFTLTKKDEFFVRYQSALWKTVRQRWLIPRKLWMEIWGV